MIYILSNSALASLDFRNPRVQNDSLEFLNRKVADLVHKENGEVPVHD